MRLKDIMELQTYDLDPESKVEIFDMEDFEERINEFSDIYLPKNEDCDIYPFAFLLDESILIVMEA